MNTKKLILASVAVFVAFQVLDFIIHSVILSPVYKSLANVWRPDMMSKMWIMTVASAITSVLFVYIFIKGYENRGIMEGVRYGIIIGLFMNIICMFSQYVVYPIPFSLVVQWVVYGMIEFIICGVIAALIYKPK